MLMTVMAGCGITRTTLPPELIRDSKVLGMTGARTWAFEHSPMFEEDLIESAKQELRYSSTGHDDASGHFNILALSGGGANGAFGAGILYGWSAAGTRPTFKMVTGISTGALIAPFAFLGADYDQILKQVYTSTATKDILKFKLVFIPSDFELQPSEIFDPVIMGKLFDLGYHMALSGDPWQNHPPGYKE